MAAYHNHDWAECYDLWVRQIFGNGPAEDILVFTSILQGIMSSNSEITGPEKERPIVIVDVGTGSGRVLVELTKEMGKIEGRRIEMWGLEPSGPMLERAERFWREAMAVLKEEGRSLDDERATARWKRCGAVDFADYILEGGSRVDLLIFAAGGIGHITDDAGVESFLKEASRVLNEEGLVVVSILKDFILDEAVGTVSPDGHGEHAGLPETTSMSDQAPHQILSEDHPGLVYVKHATSATMQNSIKTESFRLEVEDAQGKLLRSHELSWDVKMFERAKWEQMVHSAGLRIREVKEGGIQIWYLLEIALDTRGVDNGQGGRTLG